MTNSRDDGKRMTKGMTESRDDASSQAQGLTKVGVKCDTEQGVTGTKGTKFTGFGLGVKNDMAPIMKALADPLKREKLRKICGELKKHRCLDEVWYGCGDRPVTMSEVDTLLTAWDITA